MRIYPLLVMLGLFSLSYGNSEKTDPSESQPNESCLDAASLKRWYLDGNLEALSSKLDVYRHNAMSDGRTIPLPCWIPVAKYTAITSIALKQDTTTGEIYFASLLKGDPHAQIFDLGVPYGIQSVFDQIRTDMHFHVEPEEMYRMHWVPAPVFWGPPSVRVDGMKRKYHDLRSIYALAGDTAAYAIVVKALKGETDPAFRLFAADLLTVVGAPSSSINNLIRDSESKESEILAPAEVKDWAYRLKLRVGSMETHFNESGTPAMNTTFGDKDGKKVKVRKPILLQAQGDR